MRHIIPISGKDSLCTALIQQAEDPSLSYEYVFCDTEMELPETYAWLDRIEAVLDISITRIGESLQSMIEQFEFLPNVQRRYCTKYSKLLPMVAWCGKKPITLYMGIRADEQRVSRGHGALFDRMIQVYPLQHRGITLPMVYQILTTKNILPPTFFWQNLWDAVHKQSSTAQEDIERMHPWEVAALFAWRTRSNCYQCFYQRQYEFVGLLEHHPDLFAHAEDLERLYGHGTFTWLRGLPLGELRRQAPAIFQRHVTSVCNALSSRRQLSFFVVDELTKQPTSCGLWCGK